MKKKFISLTILKYVDLICKNNIEYSIKTLLNMYYMFGIDLYSEVGTFNFTKYMFIDHNKIPDWKYKNKIDKSKSMVVWCIFSNESWKNPVFN